MTACALSIAASCPSAFARRSRLAVMSVAYFTTLKRLAAAVEDRVVRGLQPDLAAALADALVFAAVELAAAELGPERASTRAFAAPAGSSEDAVMLAAHFAQARSPSSCRKLSLALSNGAIELELDDGLGLRRWRRPGLRGRPVDGGPRTLKKPMTVEPSVLVGVAVTVIRDCSQQAGAGTRSLRQTPDEL